MILAAILLALCAALAWRAVSRFIVSTSADARRAASEVSQA